MGVWEYGSMGVWEYGSEELIFKSQTSNSHYCIFNKVN